MSNITTILNDNFESLFVDFYKDNTESFPKDLKLFNDSFTSCHPNYVSATFPPSVFSNNFINHLKEATEFLMDMVFSIPERIFENDYKKFINYQNYDKEDEQYFLKFCQKELIKQAKLLARPDYLITPNGIKLVEMNVASAIGGIGIIDRYGEHFYRTQLGKSIWQRGLDLYYPPLAKLYSDCILKNAPVIHNPESPLILIGLVNDDEMAIESFNSFITLEISQFLRNNNFRTLTAPVQKLEIKNDGVYFKDNKIDIIITSFIHSEAKQSGILNICEDLILAQSQEKVSYYGPPVASLFDNKVNMAILSSPEFKSFFTKEENEKINKFIPATYILTKSNRLQAIEKQNTYVLKNSMSFGGHDVFIGSQFSRDEWIVKIDNALEQNDNFILQELIEPLYTRQLFRPEGVINYEMCIGGCYFDGFAGSFVREKPSNNNVNIINCAQGGSIIPSFQRL